jgi:hypothetical protein
VGAAAARPARRTARLRGGALGVEHHRRTAGDATDHEPGRQRYLAERADLTRRMASLTPPDEMDLKLRRLAAFLRDLGEAWTCADQAQRNQLARRLLQQVRFEDDRVVTFRPQPEFASLFDLLHQAKKVGTSGSDGIRTRDLSLDRAAC